MSLCLHFCPVCCIFTSSLGTSYFTHHNTRKCNTCCQTNSSSIFLLPVTCFEFGFVLLGHSSMILVRLRLFRAGHFTSVLSFASLGSFEKFPLFCQCPTGSDTHSFLSSSQTRFGKHRRGGSLAGWKASLPGVFFSPSRHPGLTLPVFLLFKDVIQPFFPSWSAGKSLFCFCSPLTWEHFFYHPWRMFSRDMESWVNNIVFFNT